MVAPFIKSLRLIFEDISINEMPLSSFKLTLNKIMPLILPMLDKAAFKLSQCHWKKPFAVTVAALCPFKQSYFLLHSPRS